MKNEEIKHLKNYKRILMIAMAGSLGLTSYGCSKIKNNNRVDTYSQEQEVCNDIIKIDSQEESNVIKNDEVMRIDTQEVAVPTNIILYKKNTYGYILKKAQLLEEANINSNSIEKIDKFQKVVLLEKTDEFTKIKYGKKIGYIESNKISKIGKTFIDVDISKQQLKYYSKGKAIIKSDVVTGLKDSRDTVLGCYKIYSKQENATLVGPGYKSHVDYWMPFYKGYGLHDADWRSSFGDEIYKSDGSHGCVNMPDKTAKKIYEKSKVGTKVLIHK